ncbi:MAG: hypothetical protein WA705_18550 [Candidatus Ozemobacteraceae bacterium]
MKDAIQNSDEKELNNVIQELNRLGYDEKKLQVERDKEEVENFRRKYQSDMHRAETCETLSGLVQDVERFTKEKEAFLQGNTKYLKDLEGIACLCQFKLVQLYRISARCSLYPASPKSIAGVASPTGIDWNSVEAAAIAIKAAQKILNEMNSSLAKRIPGLDPEQENFWRGIIKRHTDELIPFVMNESKALDCAITWPKIYKKLLGCFSEESSNVDAALVLALSLTITRLELLRGLRIPRNNQHTDFLQWIGLEDGLVKRADWLAEDDQIDQVNDLIANKDEQNAGRIVEIWVEIRENPSVKAVFGDYTEGFILDDLCRIYLKKQKVCEECERAKFDGLWLLPINLFFFGRLWTARAKLDERQNIESLPGVADVPLLSKEDQATISFTLWTSAGCILSYWVIVVVFILKFYVLR